MSTCETGQADSLRGLFRYLLPHRLQVTLIAVGLALDLAFDTALRLSFKFLLDDALIPGNWSVLVAILAGLLAAAVVVSLLAVWRDHLYARLSAGVLRDLRSRLFSHLQGLSMGYYSRTQVGDLMSRFTTDLASVENALVMALPSAATCVLGILFSVIPLFLLEWRMALLAVLGLPLCLIGPRLLEKRASAANYRMKDEQARVASLVHENLGAQAVVKAFGLQRSARSEFDAQLATLHGISVRSNFLCFLIERTPNVAALFLQILVIGLGALLVFNGCLSVGSLVSFHVLFMSVTESVSGITWVLPYLIGAGAGMRRIDDLLAQRPQVADAERASLLPRIAREIAFQKVTFSYTGEQPNLKDADFAIPHGSSVAFVGPSGSGKSTVLNLIMRFYDPDQGRVCLDGHDLRHVTQESLRAQMGVVFQENLLFNMSVRENLRLGRQDATDEEVEAAAKAAEIHDFILSLPEGYDTAVGERGGRLSGGQRQRVAIARAILRNPEILILDEATSALDPGTESSINATLERLGRGRTVACVTHRLASVTGMDRIVVLEGGQVVEQGRHEELLARNGLYRRLWEKQSGFTLNATGDRAQVQVERLRNLPILETLDPELLGEVARLFATEQTPEGRVVVQQGDPGDRFYIIVRGRVDVLRADSGGAERRLQILETGDHFGEIALLRNVPRTATVRTLCPCVFLTLQRDQFSYLLSRAPGVRERLEQVERERERAQHNPASGAAAEG